MKSLNVKGIAELHLLWMNYFFCYFLENMVVLYNWKFNHMNSVNTGIYSAMFKEPISLCISWIKALYSGLELWYASSFFVSDMSAQVQQPAC